MKIEGSLNASKLKVAIVSARFNEFITSKLLGGAIDCLKRHDINPENIDEVWVPGAFEIPLAALALAESKKYDAVICLGAVIRGSTSHYDYVCLESARGLNELAIKENLAIGYGIITVENEAQAIERADMNKKDKGGFAANTCLEMIKLRDRFL